MGGIYALHRIGDDSKKDRSAIVETLSTYVRENAPRSMHDELRSDKRPTGKLAPRIDIQAALTALGRRDRSNEGETDTSRLDLSQTDLSMARLEKANFSSTMFLNADLRDATLSEANFSHSILFGANLSRANLPGADCRRSTFEEVMLVGTKFDVPIFTNGGADLREANFANADLSEAYFGRAKLDGANFIWAELDRADLRGTDLSLVKNLTQRQLEKAFGDTSTKPPATFRSQNSGTSRGRPS